MPEDAKDALDHWHQLQALEIRCHYFDKVDAAMYFGEDSFATVRISSQLSVQHRVMQCTRSLCSSFNIAFIEPCDSERSHFDEGCHIGDIVPGGTGPKRRKCGFHLLS
jgi:hypothetical protein